MGKIIEHETIASIKKELDTHINKLLELGVRKANIEIEIMHHVKKLLKND